MTVLSHGDSRLGALLTVSSYWGVVHAAAQLRRPGSLRRSSMASHVQDRYHTALG